MEMVNPVTLVISLKRYNLLKFYNMTGTTLGTITKAEENVVSLKNLPVAGIIKQIHMK